MNSLEKEPMTCCQGEINAEELQGTLWSNAF